MGRTWLFGPCIFLLVGPLAAQTTSLDAAGDTYLKSGSPNKSQGAEPALRVQSSGNNRSLVRFDQAAIAATVGSGSMASASLELFIEDNADNWSPDGRTVDAHRLSVAWTEAGATWNCPVDGHPGNSSPDCAVQWVGGSFEEEPSDTVLHTNGLAGWVSFDVTADVQGFLGGAANHGWLVKKTEEGQNGRADYTSRQGAAGQAPRLVLVVESAAFDEVPPSVAVTAPSQSVVVNDPTPEIVVEYGDGGSGIDVGSFSAEVDGVDVTSSCTVSPASAVCEPPPLAGGSHTVTARVADLAGNVAEASRGFELLLGPGMASATVAMVADTYLRQGQPNQNQGSEGVLRVRQSGKNRALLRVDPAEVASLVAGATLLSARLELFIDENGDNWGRDGRTVDLHRLTAPWSEDGATWNCAVDADPGNQQADCAQWAGGTFEEMPTVSVLHTHGLAGWLHYDVTADVNAFLSGAPGHGWLLKKHEEGASGRVDYTAREGTAGFGPRLLVVFEIGGGEDTEPPDLAFTAPDPVVMGDPMPTLTLAFSDAGSGIDTGSLTVSLDGADLTASCTVNAGSASCPTPLLTAGRYQASATLADLAGNLASAIHVFDLVLDLGPPRVTLQLPADGSLIATPQTTVAGTVSTTRPLVSLTVAGQPATVSGETFSAEVALIEGENYLRAIATDDLGRMGSVLASATLDTTSPMLTLLSPGDGQQVNTPEVRFAGNAADLNGVAVVEVDGQELALTEGRFDQSLPLVEGANSFMLRAVDVAGNSSERMLTVRRLSVPSITITAPPNLSLTTGTSVDVRGRVTGNGVAVTVEGVDASVDGEGEFLAQGIPIADGGNALSAVATASNGGQSSAQVFVFRDARAPRVVIYHPTDGLVLSSPSVNVTGLVNDVVVGTVNIDQVTVIVNGQAVEAVTNRTFLLAGLPLVPGENVITATAVDAGGNSAQSTVRVIFDPTLVRSIAVVSGDLQQGTVGTELPLPLVVGLTDSAGNPVAGQPVVFKVITGGRFDNGHRLLAALSNDDGLATVRWTLGDRGGVQRVRATAAGFRAEALFAAVALPGPAALLHVDSGSQQTGAAGQELPNAMVTVVTDSAFNRIGGVPVTFRVVRGEGHFEDGSQERTEISDDDGRIAARLTLDSREGIGNNVVEATLWENVEGPRVTFVASGRAAGEPAATSVSGIVLDNTNAPVAGVTLRIKGTALTAVSDDNGLFRIPGAPVGAVKLIVDGSTVTRQGSWPDLEFNLVTVAGRDNTVNMPIYLLSLDLGNGIYVDEIRGGTLTVPDVPGLALEVAPGSVTFPGGGKSGLLSVTVVHNDKIPMVPNFGQQPRIIVTIQPAGAEFDPPARLTFPNVDGLSPGSSAELYSFDHDLGSFVGIGPGTVSDDGTVVVSDPGVGVVKAGWHCGGNPAAAGTPHKCPLCHVCNGSQCVPGCALGNALLGPGLAGLKTGCGCSDGDPCTVNDRCADGGCVGDRKKILSVDIVGDDVAQARQPITFFSLVEDEHCRISERDYLWDFGDGAVGSGPSQIHAYAFPGEYDVTLKVSCHGCPGTTKTNTMKVKVIDILVLSADVTAGADGEIDVFLAPDGTTGTLTLELLSPGSHRVLFQDRPGGRYTETFNIPGLAEGEYMNVKGTWKVEGLSATDQIGYHILVLGNWRHSQYNTPHSGGCGGAPIQSYITFNNAAGISPCFNTPPGNFQTVMLPQRFVDEVNENGSGNVDGTGDVQVDVFCPTTAAAPADAPLHTFRQQAIVPACGTNLGATTLAGCLGDPRIGCGDRIFIHTVDTKTVTDNCPACCRNGRQFDNYTLAVACDGIGDLGNFMTIKLFP